MWTLIKKCVEELQDTESDATSISDNSENEDNSGDDAETDDLSETDSHTTIHRQELLDSDSQNQTSAQVIDINDEFLEEIDDTGINYENILPRIRQNLTIISERPVYHALQRNIQLIPQQPGQEFCQQYSQIPL